MNRMRKKKIILYSTLGIITFAAIASAVIRCAYRVLNSYTDQLMQNLYDVSSMYSETLQTQIQARYELLESINKRFEMGGVNRENIPERYRTVIDSFHLKRLGFLDKDGVTYATDTNGINLSYREFFKESIQGKVYISDILNDALSEDHDYVTVISMPAVGPSGEIEGVTGITYESEVLSNDMSIKSFDGYGDNFVINSAGHVVVTSDSDLLKVGDSITGVGFDIYDLDKNKIEGAFVRSIAKNERLDGLIATGDERYFFTMLPVSVLEGNAEWFVLSIVPESYLLVSFFAVRQHIIRMVIIVLMIVLMGIIVSRYYYRRQKKLALTLAYKSKLTGGPNMSRFLENMANVNNRNGFIAYMNLEDFAHTSVATGSEKSNKIIKKIWGIIKENLKQNEYAGHDNADAFVLFIREDNEDVLKERLTNLRNAIHEEGHKMDIPWVFAKFGVCKLNPEDDVKTVISKAEYTVFDTWGITECISFYNEEDLQQQSMNKILEDRFSIALAEERFEIWFQPKYSTDGENMTGAEALVRWRRDTGELIPPGVFIPLLEKNGDISKLDEYVFKHVCMHLREWKDKGVNVPPVSINLSRATLYRDKIVETYVEIMKEYDLSPAEIQIEVTETIVGGSENIQELLTRFREQGIKVLMDDFGSGYSSLSTLNMKCFDTLKIDKSLIDEIGNDYGRIIIYQTIEMGCQLGLYITAEGVEDKEQLEFLNKTKCNDIQGYYFSKPLPAAEFEEMLGKQE